MAKIQKHGLGSGLSTLIPQEIDPNLLSETTEKIHHLSLELIEPNEHQPRKDFDETELKQLASSIKLHGILQPIVVSPKGERYQLIAGERRLRASKLANKKTIPALIRTFKDLEKLEVTLIENVQRVDLSPIEQAISIEKLHQQFNMTYEAIAGKLGKALSTVNNIARLLQLPQEAIEALNKKFITEGHARSILALKDFPKHQKQLLEASKKGWSVRQAERYVSGVKKAGIKDSAQARARVSTQTNETKRVAQKLNTEVYLRRMAKGGRLEIVFKDDNDLERIVNQIS